MSDLLAAQYPVLTWWGILTVLQRAAGTATIPSPVCGRTGALTSRKVHTLKTSTVVP
jgi:hypothetical protein